MYFNVNINVFFKLIKVHLLVSELYIYQNARCSDKKGYCLGVSPFVESAQVSAAKCRPLCSLFVLATLWAPAIAL